MRMYIPGAARAAVMVLKRGTAADHARPIHHTTPRQPERRQARQEGDHYDLPSERPRIAALLYRRPYRSPQALLLSEAVRPAMFHTSCHQCQIFEKHFQDIRHDDGPRHQCRGPFIRLFCLFPPPYDRPPTPPGRPAGIPPTPAAAIRTPPAARERPHEQPPPPATGPPPTASADDSPRPGRHTSPSSSVKFDSTVPPSSSQRRTSSTERSSCPALALIVISC